MFAEHTAEEIKLWSQIKEEVLRNIHESQFTKEIQCKEHDGQFILWRKTQALRVVLSFTSPVPLMYVHFENDNAPPQSPLMLRVENRQLINAASDKPLAVEDLVINILTFLQAEE